MFDSGLDGRNASISAWLVLQEHVAVVYRDVFFLRHGHSGLWQPVQCALRSGLFILRQKITSQAAASQPASSTSTVQPASASDSPVAVDAAGAHDLCVYSFQLDDLVVLREVLPQHCRPFVGVDFFALRMTKVPRRRRSARAPPHRRVLCGSVGGARGLYGRARGG